MKLTADIWDLPIKASLVTREGFHKPLNLNRLEKCVRVPKFSAFIVGEVRASADLPSDEPQMMTFYLESYKEVKPKKGLHYVVAVYREA